MLSIGPGGELAFRARFARPSDGEPAQLESLVLDAKKASLGPAGVKRIAIHPDGRIDIDFEGFIPSVHVRAVADAADGSLHFEGPLGRGLKVTRQGEIRALGVAVGQLPASLLEHWPLRASDVTSLLGL